MRQMCPPCNMEILGGGGGGGGGMYTIPTVKSPFNPVVS